MLGQAQTGTGKTAAFALPMLSRIEQERGVPQVLVLTPTRELAIQVAEAFRRYASGLPGLRVAAIYGGQDYHTQFRQLDRGVHVVVGTPGRVMDHVKRGSLKLDGVSGLVLDEADEMLQMGFAEDVEWVLQRMPRRAADRAFLGHDSRIDPSNCAAAPSETGRDHDQAEIRHARNAQAANVATHPDQKREVLARILEAEPIDGVLVFVNTKGSTEPLAEFLSRRGTGPRL